MPELGAQLHASGAGDDEPPGRDDVEALVEEYFERRRSGESSDVDDFARRVPGREREFKELVETLNALESAATPAPKAKPPLESRERLGRFRLLRLIGRGGMGAVYEAADDELARRFALKILPGHATLDEREIARFRREAQAAARLRHPHIVPVFGVGEDDGTHWLAMQLIDGESLEQLLKRWRFESARPDAVPGPPMPAREVARHGLAIAEALECAHAEGVLHRDVKPSNLLLDASGVVWVTDFGLAKSEGTATLTRTGEAVGTPRYMAPEAFSGWSDPRTDVWGVGATLYEMLSGRPPFESTDRAQLLRLITAVEPAPLHRLDPSIPRDLATIVHKCLQKEPAARYATPRALADDLRRFLADEPIRARPPSLAYRIGLLGRRHPTATLLLVLALAGGVVMTSREASRARAAEARAQRRFDDVRRLAGSFLFEFHDAIRNLPGSTAARALVVKRGLEYLDQLAAESAEDPGLRRELAAAYQKVGDVQGNPYQPNLGDTEGARRSYRAAIDLLEPIVASDRASDEDRAVLATALLIAGGIEVCAGEAKGGVELSRRGLALREELAARDPTPARRQDLAVAWQYLAFGLVAAGQDEEVAHALDSQASILDELLARSPDDPALRRGRGQNLFMIGQRLMAKNDPGGASKRFAEAIRLQRELLAADPGNTSLKRDLSWTLTNQGILCESTRQDAGAMGSFGEALALSESLETADPESRDARTLTAIAHNNLASPLVRTKRPEEALDHATAAIARCEALVAADPKNAFVERLLGTAYASAGDANAAIGDAASLDTACDLYEKSIAVFERLEAAGRLLSDARGAAKDVRARLERCEARLGSDGDR
jgi:tetratricopeptide (TPR) repeat protein